MQREHILLVDDQAASAQLGCLLRDEGFVVGTTHDSVSVLEATRTYKPDLLVLAAVGEIDAAVDMLRTLQTDPSCPAVIVLSTHDEQTARQRILELGALDYVTQPVDARELVARVRCALRRVAFERAQRQLSASPLLLNHASRPAAHDNGAATQLMHRFHQLTVTSGPVTD